MKHLILSLLTDQLGVSPDNFKQLLSILEDEEGKDCVAALDGRSEEFTVNDLPRIRIVD